MPLSVYNQKGDTIKPLNIPKWLKEVKISPDLIYQVATTAQKQGLRSWAHAKDRSEVSGGGRKPWRQKGTGRARHGSSRSPLWKGGGVTFGPTKEKVFHKKINKKMRKLAIAGVISQKIQSGNVVILDELTIAQPQTKEVVSVLKRLLPDIAKISCLLVVEAISPTLKLASRNIPKLLLTTPEHINIKLILGSQKIIITEKAFSQLLKKWEPHTIIKSRQNKK